MSDNNSNLLPIINNNEKTNFNEDKKDDNHKKNILINLGKKLFFPIIKNNNSVLNRISKNKEENGPIYLFTSEQKKVQRPKVNKNKKKNIVQSYIKIYELGQSKSNETQDYNVFNAQDKKIKDLMVQFYEKEKKKKISKLHRRKIALNRLYDISIESNNRIMEAKKFKSLNLEDYQENILTSIPVKSMGQGVIMDLVQSLQNLKHECDSVKPLPPINVKLIEDHVYKKNNAKSVKKMSLKEFLGQSNDPKDEYEKEQRIIKNLRSYKVLPKFKRNKNYDFLPNYLRQSLNKNLKFHL